MCAIQCIESKRAALWGKAPEAGSLLARHGRKRQEAAIISKERRRRAFWLKDCLPAGRALTVRALGREPGVARIKQGRGFGGLVVGSLSPGFRLEIRRHVQFEYLVVDAGDIETGFKNPLP